MRHHAQLHMQHELPEKRTFSDHATEVGGTAYLTPNGEYCSKVSAHFGGVFKKAILNFLHRIHTDHRPPFNFTKKLAA